MNFVCAVRCCDCRSVFQLKERDKAGIDFLHRHAHSWQAVWSGLVIGSGRAWPRHERQCKMQFSLANHPYAKLPSGIITEINEACDIAKAKAGGKARDPFLCKHIHKLFVGPGDLREKRGRLLPFAFLSEVAVISPAKRKNREKMRFVLEIMAQPAPCGVIGRSQLSEGRGTELRMFANECGYFHRIHKTDRTEASSPGITISIRR